MSKQGGGGVISNPKNFIANLRNLAHIYKLLQKKAQCNFQKVTGGGQGRLGILQKTSIFESRVVPYLAMYFCYFQFYSIWWFSLWLTADCVLQSCPPIVRSSLANTDNFWGGYDYHFPTRSGFCHQSLPSSSASLSKSMLSSSPLASMITWMCRCWWHQRCKFRFCKKKILVWDSMTGTTSL